MTKKEKEHSKYYYEYDRNMSTTLDTMTNTDKHLLARDKRVPEYYKGKNGYQARKVCDNFDLTYHLATATTYILRAYKKHDTPVDCIKKAIAHLEFELEKINEK
tara:strand:+ start:212 stop:523 length:312 start_codon:yes stop_codon:yes gene_type:complete